MKKFSTLYVILLLFLFGSCVEIIEDLTVNKDGSGSLKFTVNLSASATKLNGILALDSLNGKRVPSKQEIEEKINHYKLNLAQKEGIQKVLATIDFETYIVKLIIDFEQLNSLQKAVLTLAEEEGVKDLEKWKNNEILSYSNRLFTKKALPFLEVASDKIKLEDKDKLKEGKYISILRFEDEVVSVSHPKAKVSSNRKNVMIPFNPAALLRDPSTIFTRVKLKGDYK